MATHPQTVWDATELNRLRSVRTTTHATLANNLRAYLDRWNGAPVLGTNVMGFAMMTRIWGDRTQDRTNAINSLMNHCNAAWSTDKDLGQARDILNGAIGYDVLHDLLDAGQRSTCYNKIVASAEDLANAADGGIWWTTDLVRTTTGPISPPLVSLDRPSKASMPTPRTGGTSHVLTSRG